ncbi:MAG: ZIP family metal transporter, partial [Limisphaerales bacterium]
MNIPVEILNEALIAGVLASLACGLGVFPLKIKGLAPSKHTGVGYGLAGGLMFSASIYNLILPGLDLGQMGWDLSDVIPIIIGIFVGSMFMAIVEKRLHQQAGEEESQRSKRWGGRTGILVLLAMTIHSIPEGVAVGVGYTSDAVGGPNANLGPTLALAIAIHNIPEGLAVAIPLRSAGASIPKCFLAAVFTSIPQPIASIPAVALAWFFQPLMPFLMGFAAGAMIFLVILELIPEALHTASPAKIAWAFVSGFCLMML